MTSMIEFQIRRRQELQAYSRGATRDTYGFHPEPPATAVPTGGKGSWANTGHLNLTMPIGKIAMALPPRTK